MHFLTLYPNILLPSHFNVILGYIQPINLPTVSLLNETQVTALGWGQTSDSE
jgi:hypothetical protein